METLPNTDEQSSIESLQFASDLFSPTGSSGTSAKEREESYLLIGKSLMSLEASFLRVGIPWIPPSKRQRSLERCQSGDLFECVRLHLVNVNTQVIEMYIDDLESERETSTSNCRLGIDSLNSFERYSWIVIICGVIFSSLFISMHYMGISVFIMCLVSLITGYIIGSAGGLVSSEKNRRASFAWVLDQEVLRRKGGQFKNGSPLTLTSAQT